MGRLQAACYACLRKCIEIRRPYGKPSDLWSAGAAIYTLLAGRRPFEARSLRAESGGVRRSWEFQSFFEDYVFFVASQISQIHISAKVPVVDTGVILKWFHFIVSKSFFVEVWILWGARDALPIRGLFLPSNGKGHEQGSVKSGDSEPSLATMKI